MTEKQKKSIEQFIQQNHDIMIFVESGLLNLKAKWVEEKSKAIKDTMSRLFVIQGLGEAISLINNLRITLYNMYCDQEGLSPNWLKIFQQVKESWCDCVPRYFQLCSHVQELEMEKFEKIIHVTTSYKEAETKINEELGEKYEVIKDDEENEAWNTQQI